MTTPSQPRLLTMADLNDRAKYLVSSYPVFGPHTRTFLTPQREEIYIVVAEKDLQTICKNTNKRWASSGVPGIVVIGHRKNGGGVPETQQPPAIGYALNFKVGELGGKPWIWCDIYEPNVSPPCSVSYPFRSAEYDPESKTITGVALLVQDPFLDQGIATYQRGLEMAEEMKPEWTPEEEAQYAKMCKYMKAKYPKMAAYMDDPSSTNTDIPQLKPEAKPGNPPAHYSAAPEYTALQLENTRLMVERDLDQLAFEGVRFDRAVELPKLVAMAGEERAKHIGYMKVNYQRSALAGAGGWLPVASGGGSGAVGAPKEDTSAPLDAMESQRALNYSREKGIDFAEGVRMVLAERTKK